MDWNSISLAEQLGNVGSEFDRAVRWQQKGQKDLAFKAAARTLTQLDMTLQDIKHTGRRREIARLREEICQVLFSNKIDEQSSAGLQKYLLAFATAARLHKGL